MNTFLQAQRLCRSSGNLTTLTTRTLCYWPKKLQFTSSPVLRVTCAPSLSCSRNFWETFPFVRPVFHLKDGLDKETHELVYRCQIFNYAFYAQLVSISTFIGQVIFGLYYAYQSIVYNADPSLTHFSGFSVIYDLLGLSILGLFTLHNIALYYISQRMLLRIYYRAHTDEYIFVSLHYNPFQCRHLYCKPGDLNPLFRNNLLAILGNYKMKDRIYFVKYDRFHNLWHFNRLLSKQSDVW